MTQSPGLPPSETPAHPTGAHGAAAAMLSTLPGSDDVVGDPQVAPGSEFGRYRFVRRVGEGGMGVVYEARDRELDRAVAIKVLRWSGGAQQRAARLRREAQTMAKLAHQHIVSVFDVGDLGGDVFVAMEFVEGEDLARWLSRQRRPWREVVDVFLQAARGLEAAHAAGVVHRDFKPSNVMIGRDGRVRVLDFGLARTRAEEHADAEEHAGARVEEGSDDGAGLTETGAILGTPAYLAPAQLRGEVADALSDQYAFAVSLRQALTGSLPFSGDTAAKMYANILAGRVVPWPASAPPRRLRRLVARAMSLDAAARFPSMSDVIKELRAIRAAAKRRVFALTGVATLVVVAGVAGGLTRRLAGPERPSCDGGAALLADAWGPRVAGIVKQRFDASDSPSAAQLGGVVRDRLDAYARRWIEKRREVCRATFDRGEQSERVMMLRFGCLERRRDELTALTQLLQTADRGVVERSVSAVSDLTGLEPCDDVVGLESLAPLPTGVPERAALREVQAEVDRATALRRAGKYQEGLELIKPVLTRAEELKIPQLLAGALWAAAELENWGGDAGRAEALYRRAALVYAEIGDDAGLTGAWVTLVFVIGVLEGDTGQAAKVGEFARTLVARRREDRLLGELENNLGAIAYGAGRFDDATVHFKRALTLRRKVLGEEHPTVANTISNLGAVRRSLGDLEGAERLGREALELRQRLLGPVHSEVAGSLRNMAALEISKKNLPLARELETKAMEIYERANGKEHPEIANSLTNLGQTFVEENNHAAAVDYQTRALALYRSGLPARHPLIGKAAFSLAESLAQLHRYEESLPLAEEALAILDVPEGNPVDRAHAAYDVAFALGGLRRDLPRARTLMREALATYQQIENDVWSGAAQKWLEEHP
ncbi:MAG: serine/threonine-protein kinase [Kofleriaceae bacterium]